MKSKQAKEFLDKPSGDWLWVSQHKQKAIEAVELAEQEMIDKAVELHFDLCNFHCGNGDLNCWIEATGRKCDRNCVYMNDFILLLNNYEKYYK